MRGATPVTGEKRSKRNIKNYNKKAMKRLLLSALTTLAMPLLAAGNTWTRTSYCRKAANKKYYTDFLNFLNYTIMNKKLLFSTALLFLFSSMAFTHNNEELTTASDVTTYASSDEITLNGVKFVLDDQALEATVTGIITTDDDIDPGSRL